MSVGFFLIFPAHTACTSLHELATMPELGMNFPLAIHHATLIHQIDQ